MHVKLFTSDGPLKGFHGKIRIKRGKHGSPDFVFREPIQSFEQEINYWLAQNPAIEIKEIRQSLVAGWFGRLRCVVTIWYELPKVMLTKEAAEKMVLDYVTGPLNRDEVAITEVLERPFGWVFYYNSKRYVQTGDNKYQMNGNYPVLVDRHTCRLHSTGLGKIEDYIERFERTGETNCNHRAS